MERNNLYRQTSSFDMPRIGKFCNCGKQHRETGSSGNDIYIHEQTDFETALEYESAVFHKYLYESETEAAPAPKSFSGVPFAPLPPPGSYWPLVSKLEPVVSYRTQTPYKGKTVIGAEGRTFGYNRINYSTGESTRHHVGIDLFAKFKDPVVAIQKGIIIKFSPFCCGKHKTTWALIVDHGDIVINYGEVDKNLPTGMGVGTKIEPGQIIAYVGKNPKGSSMLHFEMYRKGTKHAVQWFRGKKTPPEILNPTQYLLHLRDVGLRGNGDIQNTTAVKNSSNGSGWNTGLDLKKAVRSNDHYAQKLGWLGYIWDIERLLGFTNMSPSQELFAESVAKWQLRNGFTTKEVDGIIGTATWKLMQPQLGLNVSPAKPKDSLPSAGKPVFSSGAGVKVKKASYDGMKGVATSRTASPDIRNIKTPDDIITACVSEVEGGFDTVNMYDKGILSWGIMQWTVHAGSLQKALQFMKKHFVVNKQQSQFSSLFGGLDVNDKNVLIFDGKEYPVADPNLPLIKFFRNSTDTSLVHYDTDTVTKWAEIFAKAGRNTTVQDLQMKYTAQEITRSLKFNLANDLLAAKKYSKFTKHISIDKSTASEYSRSIGEYVGTNPKSKMLFFGMWTNNPTWAKIKLLHAIQQFIKKNNLPGANPAGWMKNWPAEFADLWEETLRATSVGYWGDEKSKKAGRVSRTQKLMNMFSKLTTTKKI